MLLVALTLAAAGVALPELAFTTTAVASATTSTPTAPVPPAELRAAVAQAGASPAPAVGDVVRSYGTGALVVGVRGGDAPALVRTMDGGRWGPWRAAEPARDDGDASEGVPGPAAEGGTEPVWVGGRPYQLLQRAGTTTIEVREQHHLVRTTATATAQGVTTASLTPAFNARTRTEWGARPAVNTPTVASSLRYAVVHHSASGNTYTAAQVPQVLRSVQAYHMDGRGWSDIAYNVVVDRFGTVWEGRGGGLDRNVVGAHAMGFNTSSVGVMVLGDYTAVQPSATSLESLAKVLGYKAALGGFDPTSTVTVTSGGSTTIPSGQQVTVPRVVGHRDVGATSCPGSIYAQLATVRTRARQWAQWYATNSRPTGAVESATGPAGTVVVTGYVHDRDATGPTTVRATVAGRTATATASLVRSDLSGRTGLEGWPTGVGFRATVAGVPPGVQTVCVEALDQGASTSAVPLGCTQVVVEDPTGHAPVAANSAVVGQRRSRGVGAKLRDPDGPGPYQVAVLVDDRQLAVVRSDAQGNLLAQVSGVDPGTRKVCLRVANVGAGSDTTVACRTVTVVK
jgi:hypothetical protein